MPGYGRFANGREYGRFGFDRRPSYAGPLHTHIQAPLRTELLDLIFSEKDDAEAVINQISSLIGQYRQASVNDLYAAAGLSASFQDVKYGWVSTIGFGVIRDRDGYRVDVPQPFLLDECRPSRRIVDNDDQIGRSLPLELAALLHEFSADSVSGTSTTILAEVALDAIKSFNENVLKRADWLEENVERD